MDKKTMTWITYITLGILFMVLIAYPLFDMSYNGKSMAEYFTGTLPFATESGLDAIEP